MEAGLWAIPMSSGSPDVDRIAELLEPEQSSSDRGPMIYIDLLTCSKYCKDILYACVEREEEDGFLCHMDTTVLLIVIIAAILTGVMIPILCIALCMCTRFCGMFDDQTEIQNLIHSDLRQDWDTYPSSDCPPQICNQNETTQCSAGGMALLPSFLPDTLRPIDDDDRVFKEVSSTEI